VNSNITITQDFALSSTAVQQRPVEVVAERPLIQRNTTNTIRINTQENIRNIPFRGVANIIALEAGVVQQRGNLYVRGGRAGEVAYFVDGANTTNPLFNSSNVTVVQEALEELQLQSGGWTAEHGGGNAGIIRQTVRTGGTDMKASLSYQTDDFATGGEEFLGTTSRGFKNLVATIGGPLGTNDIRFFGAYEMNFTRNRQQMFLEPFSFDNLVEDGLGTYTAGTPLPGPIEFKKNNLGNNWNENHVGQGTLLFDLNQIKLRFTGTYTFNQNPAFGNWPGALGNYYWLQNGRSRRNETKTMFGNARLTHVLNPTTFYEVGFSYQSRTYRQYDPAFGDDWKSYTDSSKNAELGYTGFLARYQGPASYSTIFRFVFTNPNSPNNYYEINKQNSVGITLDLTSQVNSRWELKLGGRIDSWTMRLFNVIPSNYMTYLYGTYGELLASGGRTFPDDYTRRVEIVRQAVTNYGYDVDGNESDGFDYNGTLLDKPYQPVLASSYIQNKFEYNDLILNVGLRYEYISTKGLTLPGSLFKSPPLDGHGSLNIIDETAFVEADPISLLLPRISFSFPVTERTVFYALYGKYAQQPSLNTLYNSMVNLNSRLNASVRQPYWLGGSIPSFLMKPERNTQYEVGLRQSLSDNFALTVSGFYKDLRNQLAIRRVFDEATGAPMFVALQNEDFGTVKGLEFTFELRRTNRLAAKVNYTLSDARGTGSTPLSSANGVTDEATARFPLFINPLHYNQVHRGSVMLDYRFDKGDGGMIFEGMGFNTLLTFNSGHPYTKIKEPQNLGQANPWNIGIRAMLDSRSRNPVEPVNSSTTPWVFNIDLNWNKMFFMDMFNFELYVNVLNLLNTKNVINVYPTTGTPYDDGWLKSPLATSYKELPNYEAFYKAINNMNRWGIMQASEDPFGGGATFGDVYGTPREIRVGMKVEL
jgi:outer membrane receptor protein involved in Fe transport